MVTVRLLIFAYPGFRPALGVPPRGRCSSRRSLGKREEVGRRPALPGLPVSGFVETTWSDHGEREGVFGEEPLASRPRSLVWRGCGSSGLVRTPETPAAPPVNARPRRAPDCRIIAAFYGSPEQCRMLLRCYAGGVALSLLPALIL